MSRRLVVVLFLDLVGWTGLSERVDPEPLQQLLETYYEICSSAVEDHGGVVEKFIGDAIMAVFGADTSREDDAPRALRTAVQIRTETGELRTPGDDGPRVRVHCGIAAGEALVTRSARAGVRVVGDVVNLAARLQSAAGPGQIVVNKTVAHLARAHFEMTPIPPLTLKGKSEPVPALLVTGQADTASDIGGDSPMVGRGAERRRLREIFRRVTEDRRSRVVTVTGPPGIGKTRLVHETVDELREAGTRTASVSGSCPSYGAHGTYAALAEILDALTLNAAPCAELMRADPRIATVLGGLRKASAPRRAEAAAGPAMDEIAWAARELLAAAAREPLVVVWDGLQWAGPSLLRLIDELIQSLRDFPLLTVCTARPEIAELDVPWMRAVGEYESIELDPLTPADSARLAALLAAGSEAFEVQLHSMDVVDRVADYSAGNPLFIRLMVEWAAAGRPVRETPPTITAMVGAMIDRLPAAAHQLVGAASVIGPEFTVDQLALLGQTAAADTVEALADQGVFRPTGDDGGYCFVQQPVHEVAYGRLEKEQRLSWHRRLAEHGIGPAFHLEAACKLLGELRPSDPQLPDLSRQTSLALLDEGTAALRQRDVTAAVDLLRRALGLLPAEADRDRPVVAIRLSDALMLTGDIHQALDVVTEIAERSTDPHVRQPCLVQKQLLSARLGRVEQAVVDELRAQLEAEDADRLAWCRFDQLRMLTQLEQGRFGAAEQAALAALGHARAIGDAYEQDRLLVALCEVRQWSPSPVDQKLAGCEELLERFAADRFLMLPALATKARCLALIGDDAGARAALATAADVAEQLRLTMGRVLVDQVAALASALSGAHADAERYYLDAAVALERAGHTPIALTMRVQAAREGLRHDGADRAAAEMTELVGRRDEMDLRGRILCASAAVHRAAADGRRDAGLHAEVLELLRDVDDPCLRGDVCFELARAHGDLGDHREAHDMAAAAVDSYAAVGATKPLGTVRAWMR